MIVITFVIVMKVAMTVRESVTMMAMTYTDDCYNCGISDDGANDFGDGNDDDDDDFNDCDDGGGDDPLFIMVMIMVMGMIIMMMVGMTLDIWW